MNSIDEVFICNKNEMKRIIYNILLPVLLSQISFAQQSQNKGFLLENDRIKVHVEIHKEQLHKENISFKDPGSTQKLISDADFSLDIVWTDWLAPGKYNNGENPIKLSKGDFEFNSFTENKLVDGTKQVKALFKGKNHHLQLLITYQIQADKYYFKRKIAIRDTVYNKHFLQKISAVDSDLHSPQKIKINKEGGFGQPVAVQFGDKGFFCGLEYPASTNTVIAKEDGNYTLNCYQHIGKNISENWIESDWVVFGLTPNSYVKKGFLEYLDDIKIASDKPYTLYNSWYDLRGEEYPVGSYVKELHEGDYMGQKNASRLYQSFRKNFIDKYNVTLDAFVLDDGWDVYTSPWELSETEFPNGLSPVIDEFKESNMQLGMWFGPSGGYSARMKRVNWFRENGYEVVGEEKHWGGAMLCLAGKKYSQAFKERTLGFVKDGVTYYKWDGIQFSCSEISHGHPVGIYSHVAILDTLTSAIESIHQVNPNVYHSITSGTWLSPWWLKHANQIWMQGEDYGYADVPSYSPRDASITYRDLILYDDFRKKDFWFPMSNMMTHGIIKGKLEELHVVEPLDKFTDNTVLYFARGISMYELYTSPDIMSDKEWEVIAKSLQWSKANFEVLMHTEMIGGDPGKKQTYGYLHLKGNTGVVAARNPYIENQALEIQLSPEFGLDANAKNLVLEQIYPYRWISPKLYQSGDTISVDLQGYETAIYEIYQLEDTDAPVLAGVPFESQIDDKGDQVIQYYPTARAPILLNDKKVASIRYQNQEIAIGDLPFTPIDVKNNSVDFKTSKKGSTIEIDLTLQDMTDIATLGFLLKSKDPDKGSLPKIEFEVDKKSISPKLNGIAVEENLKALQDKSAWYSFEMKPDKHTITLDIKEQWAGDIEVWYSGYRLTPYTTIKIDAKNKIKPRVLLPNSTPIGSRKETKKIGMIQMD